MDWASFVVSVNRCCAHCTTDFQSVGGGDGLEVRRTSCRNQRHFWLPTDWKSVVQVDGLDVFRGFSKSMLRSLYDGLPVRRQARRTGSPSYKLSESTAFVMGDGLEVRRTS
jgi:hypothetical protein